MLLLLMLFAFGVCCWCLLLVFAVAPVRGVVGLMLVMVIFAFALRVWFDVGADGTCFFRAGGVGLPWWRCWCVMLVMMMMVFAHGGGGCGDGISWMTWSRSTLTAWRHGS